MATQFYCVLLKDSCKMQFYWLLGLRIVKVSMKFTKQFRSISVIALSLHHLYYKGIRPLMKLFSIDNLFFFPRLFPN